MFPEVSGVNIGAFHAILGSKNPMVNLRSPRGQPGSNFHIWVQNPMGVLTTMFYPYPVNTSQVIPFLRSIIFFPGEKLLTPEGVDGGVSISRGLFLGTIFLGVFFQVLTASGTTAGFGSNYNTRCILPLPIIPPSFSSLQAEKRLPEVGGGFVYLGHKNGNGGLRGLGF